MVYGLVRRRFINVSSVSGRYNYSFMSQQINSGTGWLARAHTHSRPRLTHARTHTHTQHARAHAHTPAKHRCFVGPNDFPAPVFPNRKCDLNVKKNEGPIGLYFWTLQSKINRKLTVVIFLFLLPKLLLLFRVQFITILGTIQGDGRKFLDRFKSYFGSQISQSLNEVHVCRLQPKSATKGEGVFHIILSLSVRVDACCPLTFDLVSQ